MRLPRPWDSPDKNTGVCCHFLLQCMKVKSESEDAQSYPTLNNPMDCNLPGSSIHGIFQARVLEWVAIAFSAKFCSRHQIWIFIFSFILKIVHVLCWHLWKYRKGWMIKKKNTIFQSRKNKCSKFTFITLLYLNIYMYTWFSFPGGSKRKEFACNSGDPISIPGSERSAGEEMGYPLQYSWASPMAQLLKNPPAI